MTSMHRDSVFRRNCLLAAAAVAAVLSLMTGLRPWLALASPAMAAGLGLVILSGLLATVGFREIARMLFDLTDRPWYGRPRALPLLCFLLLVFNLTGVTVLNGMYQAKALPSGCPRAAVMFLALAAQLLCIAFFDWPRGAPTRMHSPPPPSQQRRTPPEGPTSGLGRSDRQSREKEPYHG